VGSTVGERGLALAGRGLVDTTRLASSPADIWKDITSSNLDEVTAALDAFIATLQALRADLAGGDRLEEIFDAANRWRNALPRR